MTVDHKTPLSKGGKNTGSNYVLACFDCNQKKGDMDYDEYMEMIGRGDE
jgi:5-methylcytosine-specific restriction endonuclease McrA